MRCLFVLWLLLGTARALVPTLPLARTRLPQRISNLANPLSRTTLHMSAAAVPLPEETTMNSGNGMNPSGLLLGFSVFAWAFIVQIPVLLTFLWSKVFDKNRRRSVDWVIHFWAWISMTACGYKPKVEGLENLPKGNALFCPNHTSFLDILTLTAFIPKPMKYVSKAEILKIPFIGWPMKLAGHIAIKTDSRRSQLETFKDTVQCLVDGNSVITFPEGTRSADGKLLAFKRGPFKMALRAGVPIVPVTICGLYKWYPRGELLPRGVPTDTRVVIHPPIDVANSGLSADELAELVYKTINAELPEDQVGSGPMVAA